MNQQMTCQKVPPTAIELKNSSIEVAITPLPPVTPLPTIGSEFGKAYLEYVRNLTPQAFLAVTSVASQVQVSRVSSEKWLWHSLTWLCFVTAVIAVVLNIVVFLRATSNMKGHKIDLLLLTWLARFLAFATPLAFVFGALFSAKSLINSLASSAV